MKNVNYKNALKEFEEAVLVRQRIEDACAIFYEKTQTEHFSSPRRAAYEAALNSLDLAAEEALKAFQNSYETLVEAFQYEMDSQAVKQSKEPLNGVTSTAEFVAFVESFIDDIFRENNN